MWNRAGQRVSSVMNAVKSEIERRHGQSMKRLDLVDGWRVVYILPQGDERLSFVVDMSNAQLHVIFNDEYLTANFPESSQN
jgi:hypothetical protein